MKLFALILIALGAVSLYFGYQMRFTKAKSLSGLFGDVENQSPDKTFGNMIKWLARVWIKIFGVVGGICLLIFGLCLLFI